MMTFRTITTTALLGLAVTHGAIAAESAKPVQKAVSFADLDLGGAAGAQALFGRLKSAARQVCSPLDGRAPAQQQRYRACVAEAISNAVVAVNEPALTEVYHARSGRSLPAARVATRR